MGTTSLYFNEFNKFVYEADDLEFWFARDLQNLFGYSKRDNFLNVIEKAKIARFNSGIKVEDHFADTVCVTKMRDYIF